MPDNLRFLLNRLRERLWIWPPGMSALSILALVLARQLDNVVLAGLFHIEVFLCDCGGQRRLLAAVLDPESIHRILLHLGLPADPPHVAPARTPPGLALPWS